MSINPREYDLDELRRMARERGGRTNGGEEEIDITGLEPGDGGGISGPDPFRAGLYRELLPLEAGAADATKPYLRRLPERYAGEHLVFEWLEFLLANAGYQGATDALAYYESVDWITGDVESALCDYLRGIDEAGAGPGEDATLGIDDHMLSLVYVAKLASVQ